MSTCTYSWCTSPHNRRDEEHWSDTLTTLAQHRGGERTEIGVWAMVDLAGQFDDEILLSANVDGERVLDVALTVEQAEQVRDSIDTAINNRADARDGARRAG
ncbi:hypothetical protein [Mycobacteroides chelonae]|uniref:hypothetical protein n=2 Tax=Mycobacteroides chelonae TaxID=1774 RepID=UPI00104259D3|nr:hypothetical protein [Mycobacteroides chelonae]QQG91997.1 hypothetical protein HBA97_08055 [Mycobacteroides chelonae]